MTALLRAFGFVAPEWDKERRGVEAGERVKKVFGRESVVNES